MASSSPFLPWLPVGATTSQLASLSILGPVSAPEMAGFLLCEGSSCGAGARKNWQGQLVIFSFFKIKDIFCLGLE